MKLNWQDIYSTGSMKMDFMSMELFEAVNKYSAAADSSSLSSDIVVELLNFFATHLKNNFLFIEKLMEFTEYEESYKTIRYHKKTLERLSEIYKYLISKGVNEDLKVMTADFVQDIFVNHINHTLKVFGKYSRKYEHYV